MTRPRGDDNEVIACVTGPLELARIRDGLPASTIVRWCRNVRQLEEMLRTAGSRLRMLIVEPRDENGSPTTPVVRRIRARRPTVAVVGYCRAGQADSRDIIDLASAGIHELVFRDATDWGNVLRQTLEHAAQACAASLALQRLRLLIPGEVQPLVEYCLFFPQLATSVPLVATALGVHRKTLVNHCQRAGVPAPSAIIAWSRLIIVAHLLETRGGVVERIALSLEYPSATALRNTLRRYTGYRPTELRRGGFNLVLDSFAAVLLTERTRSGVESQRTG